MAEKILYGVGDILKNGQAEERIVVVESDYIITCDLGTKRLIFNQYNISDFTQKLIKKEVTVIRNSDVLNVIDFDSVPQKYQEIYKENVAKVEDFIKAYGPTYEQYGKRGSNCKSLAAEHNTNLKSFLTVIRKYFQSGCQSNSLYSMRTNGLSPASKKTYKRKVGRKGKYYDHKCIIDDTVKSYFDEAIQLLLGSGRRWVSITNAYDYIIQQYYTTYTTDNGMLTSVEAPYEERPTYKQFYNYFRKHTTKLERDLVKTSAAEVRNDKRLRRSDTMYGVYGVGDLVECDACEMDVGLVKMDNVEQSIGRPVVYCMIDVASRVILAVAISFENNSFLGITNLLLNLSDDKVEYCRRYGIDIDPALWPSNIIPKRIRFDRGAENTSHKLEEVLKRLNIERELVTAGTGSLKGNIEQQFRQMHLAQNTYLENYGLIEKRHDSRHHEEAVLTIEEYTKIVINYVLAHNQDPDLNYPLSRDMIEDKKTDTTPINLWNYWNDVTASPRPITSANVLQFRYDLMLSFTAKVNNEGIHFIGNHIYDNFEDSELQNLKYENDDRKKNFEVRYDPRNVNCIYYLRNNQLHFAKLNMDKQVNKGFENLTFDEMRKLDSIKKQMLSVNKVTHEEIRRNRDSANRSIINVAIQNSTGNYATTKDMRINREMEKQDVRYSNSIATRLLPENLINIPAFDAEEFLENSTREQISDDRCKDETLEEKDVMSMTDEELEEFEEENNRRLNHVL